MESHRKLLLGVLAIWVCATLSGCSFFACSGGGPLTKDELGDWLQISEEPRPDTAKFRSKADRLRRISGSSSVFGPNQEYDGDAFSGRLNYFLDHCGPSDNFFVPARGMTLKGKFNALKAVLFPGTHKGEWLCYSDKKDDRREFYMPMEVKQYGILVCGRINAYDVDTGERVAAKQTKAVVTTLGYVKVRQVAPMDADDDAGLHALADPSVALSQARYSVKKGTTILAGLVGWGQVNRKRYVQLLWIPIPVGDVEPTTVAAKQEE